jgi:hypothetical protein
LLDKGLKELEKKLTVKMTKALQRVTDIMKNQDRRFNSKTAIARGDPFSDSKDSKMMYES